MSVAERARVKITIGMLAAGMSSLCTKTTTEAFMNVIKAEVVPEVAKVYLDWFNEQQRLKGGTEIDPLSLPTNLISLPARHAQMMKSLCGPLKLEYEEVFICPKPNCGFFRRTKNHQEQCENFKRCKAKTYMYGRQLNRVCVFRYFRLHSLLRLLYANPVTAQLLGETYCGYVPSSESMRGVHGESTI